MQVIPLSLRVANSFVQEHHRHHKPARRCTFALGLLHQEQMVGVAVVGRPVARCLDDGLTCEVNRLATDGTPNACSALYGACRRVAREMGFARIVTYILCSESGISLRAAGWRPDAAPVEQKDRWSAALNPRPLRFRPADDNSLPRQLPGQLPLFAEVS